MSPFWCRRGNAKEESPPEADLRPPTFAESVAIDNYKAASKEALGSADSVADKVVTAGFSIGTAYGAVIALVSPKDTPAPLVAALPFVFLAGAIALALYAQSIPVPVEAEDRLDRLTDAVTETVQKKRVFDWLALGALVLGVLVAGIIIADKYREPAEDDSPVAVEVLLTESGATSVGSACGLTGQDRIMGTVKNADSISADPLQLTVTEDACPDAPGTLSLPKTAVGLVSQQGG
jgi:hypothetical protein